MNNRILITGLRRACIMQRVTMTTDSKAVIGNREVVGFGMNGTESYIDRVDFPMPAIRYKENNPDIQALREKEKGDWKKLSIEEKKALYRASFCQTFAEINAPTGRWKSSIGVILMGISGALWLFIFMKKFVYPPLPVTFEEERQLAQLERMKILEVNPITGLTSRK
ncbi:cytochrome c oxidase subunit 4 isoform 1, mitochondrial [Cephus cinctus]|uniref:Cytochrome c oxidase subunit 4 n=1 Tax=Cephus cinctus TaxID=211228 RepID=A0AAJ7RB92_CEPCN|nr:cytochrome c oxidase subunit 4 isoform 1, mitochondrial [Cephus cinctus]XP_015588828.1 cytochrome c oxidase subunit 4 isoform 1, mitochondrial [Cephus cinctus]XP_015588829.1 cytochrome c oxidase subunit 4 isoform 1, mitochondrial [Cephus cinctus]XP_024937765.1 cytochrome c oxidase subunit 4 isoform 1, mitochondrial [Cephus cinctus]